MLKADIVQTEWEESIIKTSQRWHPFSASILKICLQCLPGGDELILRSLPALWETIKDDLWIGILESPWRFLIFYKDVSRVLRFRIMSRLLLWDYKHLLASQIYVHVTPQNRSVEGCKTLDVWRETTCSSLFLWNFVSHPHSHSLLVCFSILKVAFRERFTVHRTESPTMLLQ